MSNYNRVVKDPENFRINIKKKIIEIVENNKIGENIAYME